MANRAATCAHLLSVTPANPKVLRPQDMEVDSRASAAAAAGAGVCCSILCGEVAALRDRIVAADSGGGQL